MSTRFAELDRRSTPMGEVSLRRRLEPTLLVEVYEAMLGDEHLMSSLFTTSEIQLARLALAEVAGDGLDVIVGGLGLGYTAQAVLEDPRVRSLHVIEALDAVIAWHHDGLLPLGHELNADPRCHIVHGDFFALADDGAGFAPDAPERPHAVLVDIDHTPRHLLHPRHAAFYTRAGLGRLAAQLTPGGVFALWSDAAPDDAFLTLGQAVFAACDAHVVSFSNPHTGGEASNTVYVARQTAGELDG